MASAMTLTHMLLVLAGGFVGGLGRHVVGGAIGRRVGEHLPWGTLAVNLSGALAIGLVVGLGRLPGSVVGTELVRDFLIFGLLGGYTTVSAFSLQTVNLLLEGRTLAATGYVAMSVAGCLLATFIGLAAVTLLAGGWTMALETRP